MQGFFDFGDNSDKLIIDKCKQVRKHKDLDQIAKGVSELKSLASKYIPSEHFDAILNTLATGLEGQWTAGTCGRLYRQCGFVLDDLDMQKTPASSWLKEIFTKVQRHMLNKFPQKDLERY